MKLKIYIAGKISGLPISEYTAKFEKVEILLSESGFEPVNPCNFGIPENTPTTEALPKCIEEMLKCNAIFMLNGWRDSLGGIIEHNIASHHKLPVYYQEWHSDKNLIKFRKSIKPVKTQN